ncbi:MAG: HD domain-containing protein [Acidimicrobiia bacterium]|nr:HD domain-containing protein [Acidimicrobiia bacterium]
MSRKRPLLDADHLRGRAYAEAHSAATDAWFRTVAQERLQDMSAMALLAVGGYGRGELCPASDIDVVLVHGDDVDGGDLAEALWYPAWDRGLALGYVVVTVEQARTLVEEEFEWATALLDTRLIVGNAWYKSVIDRLTTTMWSQRRLEMLHKLARVVENRHVERGDAASQIEPNLKEGRGGLRDVHAMIWASGAQPGFAEGFVADLQRDVDVLLEARVELHRLQGRSGDTLTLEYQDALAEALGHRSSNELMLRLARSARRIAWYSDEAWRRWEKANPSPDSAPREVLSVDAPVHDDPLLPLRMAAQAAQEDLVLDRRDLARFADSWTGIEEPWPSEARDLFAQLFLAGRPAVRIVEDLDHFGLMKRLMPEWVNVQCRPQRNVLHTYTVDRHLCEAAVNAADLVDRVARPDLLVVGALLHDIGKGYDGDHTEVGQKIIGEIAERMGYPDPDAAVLVDLCRHHLLLPDIATRRDLGDPGTIRTVAAAVDSVEFLNTLAALTEADSIATGPSAWGSWKAGLMKDLVDRTAHVLEGGQLDDLLPGDFPADDIVELMAKGERYISGKESRLMVIVKDRLGLFTALAGAVAVSGLEVLDAVQHTEPAERFEHGQTMAAFDFVLQHPQSGGVDWDEVADMINRALDGTAALRARVARRARDYGRYQRKQSAAPPRREVIIDNDVSDWATVVEVHAPDHIGLLYHITQAMQELRLDIRRAKIQTFGPQAVDSFYVIDTDGAKVTDSMVLAEIRLALGEVVEQI